MPSIYDSRMEEAKQKQRMADLLRQQYQNQPAGQMVSGWYVPNTGGAVVGALSNIIGAYQDRQAQDEMKGIEREKAQATIQALNKAGIEAPEAYALQAGTPAQQPAFTDRALAFLRGQEQPQATPAAPYQQNVAQTIDPNAMLNLAITNPDMASAALAVQKLKHDQFKEAEQERMKGVPTGFRLNAQGQLVPMEIAGGGNYADWSMDKALAGQRYINPVEAQNMQVQQANLALATQAAQRAQNKEAREEQKASEGKDVPATQLSAQTENFHIINQINNAIDEVKNNPDAFGAQNYLPSAVTQRIDPKGVKARGAVAEISATKLHDLSGAAVSPTEAPRFSPFLPSATDSPEKIIQNLERMKSSLIDQEDERKIMYSDGWKPQLKSYKRFDNPSAQQPSGIPFSQEAIQAEIARRRGGQ